MSEPSNMIPENFSVDQLAEPRTETLATFQAACTELDEISDVMGSWRDDKEGEPSGHHVTYFLKKAFLNGSKIDGSSTHGTDEWLDMYAESMPIRSINLRTKEGVRYNYTEETPGKVRLWIRKPGDRVMREVNPVSSIDMSGGNGTSLHIDGTPEAMRAVAALLAEQREVRKQGLDTPTDASLNEFTEAIRAALESGVAETPPPAKTDPSHS